jgi:hypothetical protein
MPKVPSMTSDRNFPAPKLPFYPSEYNPCTTESAFRGLFLYFLMKK